MPAVLHVLEAFAGGTERHLLDLVRGLEEFDHVLAVPPFHLCKSTEAAVGRARAAGAAVELVDMRRSPSPAANTRALLALRRLLRRARPDLIHGHSSIGGAFARLAGVGTRLPVVYTPNGIERSRAALAAERRLAGWTTRLIAVSESEGAFAVANGLADRSALTVIPNGIEPEPPPPLAPTLRARLGIPDGVPLVGSLGRLAWQKAPEVYASACAIVAREHPDAHFVLIGSGPGEAAVAGQVGRPGLAGRFHRLPGLDGAAAAFGELDVFALASRFEGGPYSVLEAMRAGVPVAATAADGTRDIVDPGITGLLVPVDDPLALAAAIGRLLGDPAERRAFGAAGRRRVSERFDVHAMVAATEKVYTEVAS